MFGCVIIDNREICKQWLIDSHIKYLPEDWGFMHIKDHSVRTLNDYNTLMTSKALWESIPFEKVLVFQQDSRLLRQWDHEFEQYDYIGAPWSWQELGGNGGLSWRSKEMMLKVIDRIDYDVSAYGYEDVYFSNHVGYLGGKVAPRSVATRFSCESVFALGSMGVHAIEKYLSSEQVNAIMNQYK